MQNGIDTEECKQREGFCQRTTCSKRGFRAAAQVALRQRFLCSEPSESYLQMSGTPQSFHGASGGQIQIAVFVRTASVIYVHPLSVCTIPLWVWEAYRHFSIAISLHLQLSNGAGGRWNQRAQSARCGSRPNTCREKRRRGGEGWKDGPEKKNG